MSSHPYAALTLQETAQDPSAVRHLTGLSSDRDPDWPHDVHALQLLCTSAQEDNEWAHGLQAFQEACAVCAQGDLISRLPHATDVLAVLAGDMEAIRTACSVFDGRGKHIF